MKVVFHIGYHKTGTAWLQQVFFPAHPYIHPLCNSREPWNDLLLNALIATPDGKFDAGYCTKLLREKISSIKDYRDNHVMVVSAERLSGHPYSGGYDSFRIAERIMACWKESYVLCVIRNQPDIISSIYNQLVKAGFPGRLEKMFGVRDWDFPIPGFNLAFYEYDLLLKRYQTLFGRDRICILPYELMSSNLEEFLKRICEFLEVPEISVPSNRILNFGLPNRGLSLFRIMNYFRLSEFNQFPIISINKQVFQFIRNILWKLLRGLPDSNGPLNDTLRAWIIDYYRESNTRLQKIVDWNIEDFKWNGVDQTR
jgi:hypothetical protein